ncbi:uncharacterized protein UBRO_20084 [Ustilago bromivora]|uniref:Uncharacterized protein n=1 Tax=Ustilago bromivora TaxID=307758 RepID=A0A1K0HDI6_9BASI|nr:uncharacterized protein UBRO_20084 [Ustilago bromivora]
MRNNSVAFSNNTGPSQNSNATGTSEVPTTNGPPQTLNTTGTSQDPTAIGPLPNPVSTSITNLASPVLPTLVASHPTAPPAPPLTSVSSAPITTPAEPSPHFVTRSDLSASIGELRQFLQDEIAEAFQKVARTATQLPPGPVSNLSRSDNIPQAPPAQAFPARLGEYLAAITYLWLSTDLIDKVHQDTLSIYDLPKLANPSWPGATAQEEPAPVVIEGFSVVKGPSTSASNRQFSKAVPNFSTFGQLWVIYLSLRSSTSHDNDISVSLGRFYQHVANLSDVFPWERVAGYVIAVCTSRFGRASASEWARFDTELHASHFQGVPARTSSTTNTKRPTARHDDPCSDQMCMSWNQGQCSGTDQRPCVRKHVCITCGGPHPSKTCTRPAQPTGPSPKANHTN